MKVNVIAPPSAAEDIDAFYDSKIASRNITGDALIVRRKAQEFINYLRSDVEGAPISLVISHGFWLFLTDLQFDDFPSFDSKTRIRVYPSVDGYKIDYRSRRMFERNRNPSSYTSLWADNLEEAGQVFVKARNLALTDLPNWDEHHAYMKRLEEEELSFYRKLKESGATPVEVYLKGLEKNSPTLTPYRMIWKVFDLNWEEASEVARQAEALADS